MNEQDKITIFDALIMPFLCSDALTIDHEGNNLFAQAICQLLNSSLLAQQDNHLGYERYERIPTRNTQTSFTPIIPEFERCSRIDRALNLAIAKMYLQ